MDRAERQIRTRDFAFERRALLLAGTFFAASARARSNRRPRRAGSRPPRAKPAARPAVSVEEAAALIAIVRSRAMKEPMPAEVPASLRAPSQTPLIVTLYSAGRPVVRTVIGPCLNHAAETAGDQLGVFLSKKSDNILSRWDVVELDVVVRAETDSRNTTGAGSSTPSIRGFRDWLIRRAGGRTISRRLRFSGTGGLSARPGPPTW